MKYINFLLQIPALVGCVFVITGLIMFYFPPKKINSLYGYRTSNSMKNQKNWNVAQRYSSLLLMKFGLILILLSSLKIYFDFSENLEKIISGILILGSVILLVLKTENKLKQL